MTVSGGCGGPERALKRTTRPVSGCGSTVVTGMLPMPGEGACREAIEEFRAAGRLEPQLASSLGLGGQVTGWALATQARLGLTGEARRRVRDAG